MAPMEIINRWFIDFGIGRPHGPMGTLDIAAIMLPIDPLGVVSVQIVDPNDDFMGQSISGCSMTIV